MADSKCTSWLFPKNRFAGIGLFFLVFTGLATAVRIVLTV